MKRCPKCQADYFDEMLEFCLEDGAKLNVVGRSTATMKTETLKTNPANSIETVFFAGRAEPPATTGATDAVKPDASLPEPAAPVSLKEKAVEKGYRTLETGTLVFALAHNWWQWLYVDRQNYGSITNFLFSADFLIWFLLLAVGAAGGLLTLKFSRKKGLAYAGLVILAVNFLLMILPRR